MIKVVVHFVEEGVDDELGKVGVVVDGMEVGGCLRMSVQS